MTDLDLSEGETISPHSQRLRRDVALRFLNERVPLVCPSSTIGSASGSCTPPSFPVSAIGVCGRLDVAGVSTAAALPLGPRPSTPSTLLPPPPPPWPSGPFPSSTLLSPTTVSWNSASTPSSERAVLGSGSRAASSCQACNSSIPQVCTGSSSSSSSSSSPSDSSSGSSSSDSLLISCSPVASGFALAMRKEC